MTILLGFITILIICCCAVPVLMKYYEYKENKNQLKHEEKEDKRKEIIGAVTDVIKNKNTVNTKPLLNLFDILRKIKGKK